MAKNAAALGLADRAVRVVGVGLVVDDVVEEEELERLPRAVVGLAHALQHVAGHKRLVAADALVLDRLERRAKRRGHRPPGRLLDQLRVDGVLGQCDA